MKKDFSIIKNNLNILSESEKLNRNILISQIEETVYLIEENSLDFNQAAEIFKEVFSLPLLSGTFMKFCDCLSSYKRFKKTKKLTSANNHKIVSAMDNLYSKAAYEQFADYELMTVDFEHTFTSVCEAVYSKRSNFAILPLFNSRDGLMTSIYKLLQKYELKIVASAKVLLSGADNETEFILAATADGNHIGEDRIMLSLTHNYDNTISELLNSMKAAGAMLIAINTLPLEYTDERCESLITFDISSCNTDTICSFMQTALPEANILGIYSIVK